MIINNEHWRPTYIFPNDYLVSDEGKVYSKRTNKILRPGCDKDGYLTHILCVNGERHTVKAHRLVAMAFIPNLDNKPAIDHINENKQDNRVSNLRWVTNKENSNNPLTLKRLRDHANDNYAKMYLASVRRDFGRKPVAVYKDGELIQIFRTQRLAAEFVGCGEGDVSWCVSGKQKQAKGYTFKRIDVKLCS